MDRAAKEGTFHTPAWHSLCLVCVGTCILLSRCSLNSINSQVFFRWIHYVIKAKDSSWTLPTEAKDLLDELKDGVILARLVKSVSEKDFPQITDEKQKTPFAVMGRLEKVLTFLKTREGLNITATGNGANST
jgi:hypothetical protein